MFANLERSQRPLLLPIRAVERVSNTLHLSKKSLLEIRIDQIITTRVLIPSFSLE